MDRPDPVVLPRPFDCLLLRYSHRRLVGVVIGARPCAVLRDERNAAILVAPPFANFKVLIPGRASSD